MNIYPPNNISELNQYLHILAKFLPGHIYWKDIDGSFLGCNAIQAQSAGLTVEEMIGKTDYNMPWHAQAEGLRKADVEIMRSGLPTLIEEDSLLSDGKMHFFLSNKVPLFDDEKKCIGILGISLDITEQKLKEQALKKQISDTKITLETIMENVPAHIFWKDRNCLLIGCNSVQARNLGFSSPEEMIGKSNNEIMQQNQSPGVIQAQGDALTKVDLEVIHKGITVTREETMTLPTGKKAIYLSKKTPLYNEAGEIMGLLGISFDMTKEKEKEALVRKAQYKLEGMTEVSASMAHELRTPLASLELATSSIEKYFSILMKSHQLAQAASLPVDFIPPKKINLLKNTLGQMRAEIRSAFMFIDMLLIKLRTSISAQSQETFTISDCIEEVLNRYPFQSGEKELISIIINQDFIVQGAKLLVTHVFFNLIKNALYHIAKVHKGDITILLDANNEYNIVTFRDTGAGIPKNVLPKIFKRFFSKTHHGAGVGLTFCKTVMKSLGGNITCNSEENQYTEFVLLFPKQFKTY